MRFHCLSDNPNKPCSILQFKQATIMLDCGLDLGQLVNYLPIPLVSSAKVYSMPNYTAGDLNLGTELRESNGRVYIDSEPEFMPPTPHSFNFSDVDVILISNYTCMLALPHITENTGFRGKVYATEPSILMGKVFMDEMIEYLDRAPRANKLSKWKQFQRHLPPPLCDIKNVEDLKHLYTKATVNDCLAKVQTIGHNEKTDCFGLIQVTPVSSGYCLGSCNWIISTGFEKIVYISSSSTLTTHPRSMDQNSIKNADCMIMTALTQTPTQMPDPMIGDFCRIVCETLKNSGNVLVPCFPSGIIYDLFECLSGQMEMNGLTTTPLFFLSPQANSSLAYSNIMAEWLSTAKHNRVYLAEEPFVHGNLMRNGRLKSFKSLQDETVHTEYRQPCVMFCGHPSLRFGDAVHFIELWGNNPNNLIIFTEPSVNYLDALAPFQPLQMKAISKPIDTSLNFTQAKKLILESRPRSLVLPEVYTNPNPANPASSEHCIDVDLPTYKFSKFEILKVPLKRTFENINLDLDLAESLVPTEVRPGVAIATITGNLIVRDNKYKLSPVWKVKTEKEGKEERGKGKRIPLKDQKPAHYLYGKLNTTDFVQRLGTQGVTDAKVEMGPNGGFPIQIHLATEEILIQVEESSTHVLYDTVEGTAPADTERLREIIKQSILACITKF